MNQTFKKKLVEGELLFGTIITLPSTEIVEIFGRAGFDWLFIDLEHSAMGIRDAQSLLQTAGLDIPCLVRVPANDETWIKKVLDMGASGIIIPQVNTVEDVKRAVRFCRYPPEGTRSVGIARAQGYGEGFPEYVASANDAIGVVVQIEHINAVDNIEEIIRVPGIDCLFIGPYDLSASMGKTGLITDPGVQEAILKVTKAAVIASIPLGIFGTNPEAVNLYIQMGYTLIAVGIDTMLISKTAKEILGSLKSDIKP